MHRGQIVPILRTFENEGEVITCNTLFPQHVLWEDSTLESWPSGSNQEEKINEAAPYECGFDEHIGSYESGTMSTLALDMGECEVYPLYGTLYLVDGSPNILSSGFYFTNYELRDYAENTLLASGNIGNTSYGTQTVVDGYTFSFNERRANITPADFGGRRLKLLLHRTVSSVVATGPYDIYRLAAVNMEFCGSSIYTCGSGEFRNIPRLFSPSITMHKQTGGTTNLHQSLDELIETPDDLDYVTYTPTAETGLYTITAYTEFDTFEHEPHFSLLRFRIKEGPSVYAVNASWDDGYNIIGQSDDVQVTYSAGYSDYSIMVPRETDDFCLESGNNVNLTFYGTGLSATPFTLSTINQDIVYNKCTASNEEFATLFISNNNFCTRDISPTGDRLSIGTSFLTESNSTSNRWASLDDNFVESIGFTARDADYIKPNFGPNTTLNGYLQFSAEPIQNVPFEAAFQIRSSSNYDLRIENIRWKDRVGALIASGENQVIDGISTFAGYQYPLSINTGGSYDLTGTQISFDVNRAENADLSYYHTGIAVNLTNTLDTFYKTSSRVRFNLNGGSEINGTTWFSHSTGILNKFADSHYNYYFYFNHTSDEVFPYMLNYVRGQLVGIDASGGFNILAESTVSDEDIFNQNPYGPAQFSLLMTKDYSKVPLIPTFQSVQAIYTINRPATTDALNIRFVDDLKILVSGDAHIQEPFKVSSVSIGADYECTGIDVSGAVELFVSGSATPTGVLDLAIFNLRESDNIDLYLHNFETVDSGISLFMKSIVKNNVNLFLKGREASLLENDIPLYLQARNSGQDYESCTLFVRSFPLVSGDMNLYLAGATSEVVNDNMSLFVRGPSGVFTNIYDNVELSISGFDNATKTLPLYLNSIQELDDSLNLHLFSDTAGNQFKTANLYISAHESIDSGVAMSIIAPTTGEYSESISLFVRGLGESGVKATTLHTFGKQFDGNESITLYMNGQGAFVDSSGYVSLFIDNAGTGDISNNTSLFIKSVAENTNTATLFVLGNTSTDSMNLYIENTQELNSVVNTTPLYIISDSGVDKMFDTSELFVQGAKTSDYVNLFIASDESAGNSGEMILFVEGAGSSGFVDLYVEHNGGSKENSIQLNLFAVEQYTVDSNMSLYMSRSSESIAFGQEMVILVNEGINENATLFVSGMTGSDNSLTLFMPESIDDFDGTAKLFVHGY